MQKKNLILWVIIFVLFFIVPPLSNLVWDSTDWENTENRNPAPFPQLTLSSFQEFPTKFEDYYNDRLPFRSRLITMFNYIQYSLFHESTSASVIIGKDDWLFYNPAGNDGDPIGDLAGTTAMSEKELESLLQHLVSIHNQFQAEGKEFILFIVPNKESIYGPDYLPESYLPDHNTTSADVLVDYLTEHSNLRIVYPKEALIQARTRFPDYHTFFRTDTHWNGLGGYIGAQCLLEELAIPTEDLSTLPIVQDDSFPVGKDLANMISLKNHLKEPYSYNVVYTPASEIISSEKDFYTYFHYKTNSDNHKTLFIIRDSFCDAMAEYLACHFEESHMVHQNSYSPEALSQYQADIVVYEVAERYLSRLASFQIE